MTDRQLRLAASPPPRWLREHQDAAARRLGEARAEFAEIRSGNDLIEIATARMLLRDALAVAAEWAVRV